MQASGGKTQDKVHKQILTKLANIIRILDRLIIAIQNLNLLALLNTVQIIKMENKLLMSITTNLLCL